MWHNSAEVSLRRHQLKGPSAHHSSLCLLLVFLLNFLELTLFACWNVAKQEIVTLQILLVVTDYDTKYSEVLPLKNKKAKLWLFLYFGLRIGFFCEILKNKGTNFISVLLKQVHKLLGIRSVRTSPYHPHTDGFMKHVNPARKLKFHKCLDTTGIIEFWLPWSTSGLHWFLTFWTSLWSWGKGSSDCV